jgi:zinc transport system permease protein
MIEALFEYTFLRNAVISSLIASIVCGIIGTIIVEKKLVSMSGGIAHTSFGGIGLGYLLGFEPIIGGLIFAVIAALGISKIRRETKTKSDTLIGMFWAVGMALGILFISMSSGYQPDMTSYLFGDILTVSTSYIKIMSLLGLIIVLIISAGFNYWKAYLFDEEYLKVMGVNVVRLEYLLFILVSLSIVILIKVAGIILAIALLTIPPAISKLFTKDLKKIMGLSIISGILLSFSGLYISYIFNIPSGSTIILVAVTVFLLTSLFVRKSKLE